MKHTRLSKRLSDLERANLPQDPGVIVCEPEEAEGLRMKYPNTILIIDDIPKSIKEVQDNVVIYEPGTDPEQLKTIGAQGQTLLFIPDNGRDQ